MKSYSEANICSECLADGGDYPHTDNTESAAWRPTCHTNSEYMAKYRTPLHPLLTSGWWSRLTYRYDILHLFDHHGITSTAVACIWNAHIVTDCIDGILPGNNQQERLDFLNAEIVAYYGLYRVSHKLPCLKLSNLISDGWPDLHGPTVKAANTRAVVPYVKESQQSARDSNPSCHLKISLCV